MRLLCSLFLCAVVLVATDMDRPMQRFRLPDIQGHDHDSIEWKGRAMVIEFMSTTCPHCAAFSSVLKQVEQRYGGRVAVVAMVNPPDTPQQVARFMDDHKVNYPILLDQGRVAYAYIRKPSFDIPYIFLIDTSGTIREYFEYSPANENLFYGNGLFPHIDKLLGASFPALPVQKN